jgi:hypothetical protein
LESAYLPLQAGEIRLLKILNVPQVHESHAIEFTLVRQNLEHRTDYIAVSYAWGAPKLKKVLETEDGTLVLITPNLWDFLCAQSRELAGQLLWIDQICINQRDLSERACQVRLMSRIFENATETIIWLGKEDDDTEHAFRCISRLAAAPKDSMDRLSDGMMSHPLERTLIDGAGRPLRDLLARPWFSRLWALQEAVLGAAPRFICGTKSVSWDEFGRAILNASVVFEIDVVNTVPIIHGWRRRRQEGLHTTLLSLLIETWAFDCTDPRDRVYALLSLQNSLPDFPVDYTAKVEEVYLSVAQALIRSTRSLELLGAVDSNDFLHAPEKAVLPSWVPDWRGPPWPNPYPEKFNFQACKDFVALRHIESISTSLKVEGRIVDHVYQVESLGEVQSLTKSDQNLHAAQAFLQDIPRRIYHGIPETNYTLPKLFNALIVRTVLAGHYMMCGDLLKRIDWTDEQSIWKLLNGERGAQHGGLDERRVWFQVTRMCYRRTIVALEEHTMALGPPNTEPGDVVCILHGSKLPIVLRCQGDKWRFIGQCYVDGIMFGEAVTWAEDEADSFEII